jgi:type III restriction enzyme
MIETKGDDRDNSDSKEKLELGRKWQNCAGANYKYFMVFENNKINADGAYNFNEFLNFVHEL